MIKEKMMFEYEIEVKCVQIGHVVLDSNLSFEEMKEALKKEKFGGNLISESQMEGALQGNDVYHYEVGEIPTDFDWDSHWKKIMEDNQFLDYLDSKKEEKKKLP